MIRLHIDLETRSPVDLPKSGQYVYAEDPRTEITVACWRAGNRVGRWLPTVEPEVPDDLADLLPDPEVGLVAHNASFERVLLSGTFARRRLGPKIAEAVTDLRRWDCTAARAACFGLPRTLEAAGNALNLPISKDKEGAALMRQMMRPRKDGTYLEDAASLDRLAAYCATDVAVEEAIDRALPPLPPFELDTWRATEAMNDRGVAVDSGLLLALSYMVDDAERDVNGRIYAATGGAVPKVSNHAALTRWLLAQGIDDAEHPGVGKAAVAALLERVDLAPIVREVLHLRREGGKSSAAKFRAILSRLNQDHRLRGALVYCGAAATKRWSSRGAQLQNMPRGGTLATVEGAIRDIQAGATLDEIAEYHAPPLVVASELIRPVFIAPPDAWLARGDYSQIEARVLAWLAGEARILDAYRAFDAGTGPDLYRVAAAPIYRVPVDDIAPKGDPRRQIGKVAELACGFQGGVGAFQAMARAYGVKIPDAIAADIVRAWRAARPGLADYDSGLWARMDAAAIRCMSEPIGAVCEVGGGSGVSFRRNENTLVMRGPSGGSLCYWWPALEWVQTPWGQRRSVVYFAEDSQTKRWTKFQAYGGLWTENLVQWTAREVMRDSLVRLEAAGLRPVLTVHDEGVCEVPRRLAATAAEAAQLVRGIMAQGPAWARGLPIAVDTSAGQRYVKA